MRKSARPPRTANTSPTVESFLRGWGVGELVGGASGRGCRTPPVGGMKGAVACGTWLVGLTRGCVRVWLTGSVCEPAVVRVREMRWDEGTVAEDTPVKGRTEATGRSKSMDWCAVSAPSLRSIAEEGGSNVGVASAAKMYLDDTRRPQTTRPVLQRICSMQRRGPPCFHDTTTTES